MIGGIEFIVDPLAAPVKGEARFDLRKPHMSRPLCFHDAEDLALMVANIKAAFPVGSGGNAP